MAADISVKLGANTSELNSALDASKSRVKDFTSSLGPLQSAFADTSKSIDDFKSSANALSGSVDQTGARVASAQGPMASFAERMWEMRQAIEGFQTIGSGFQGTMSNVVGIFAGGVTRIVAAVGLLVSAGAAATAALAAVSVEATHYGEKVRETAGNFDQSVTAMSRLKAVADRSELSLADIGKAFGTLQRKAREGDDDITAALKAIGVGAGEAAHLSQDALAVRLADAFSRSIDSSHKAEAGVALFGETVAGKLVPQLDQGAARIRELQAAADRAGVVIGPDLSAKLRGTEMGIQLFRDRLTELKDTFQGKALQLFAQLKPAIDGLIRLFADVTGNIASLIEYLGNLAGAGQRGGEQLGLLGLAAKGVAGAIVVAAAEFQEFSLVVGASLKVVYDIAVGVFADIAKTAAIAANAVYTTFTQSISGIILALKDFAVAFKSALTFDTSGVKAALAQIGDDTSLAGEKIKAALTQSLPSSTAAAFKSISEGSVASSQALSAALAKIEAQKQAQLALIAGGGTKGGPVPQTQVVGNPKAPDTDSGGSARSGIQASIDAAEGEVQALKNAEQQKDMLLSAGVSLHQISEQDKVAATQTSLKSQLEATQAIYEKLAALDGLSPAQHQEVLNKMRAANENYSKDVLKLQIEAAQNVQRTWDAATSSISGAFTGQVDGIIRGTSSLRDAFQGVMQSMLGDAIKFCIEWSFRHAETIAENILGVNAAVTAHIAGETAKTSATEAGVATRVATEIGATLTSVATTIAGVIKSIAAYAAQAFAATTAFLSSFMGPASLPIAGSVSAAVIAAGAALPALAKGAWEVPGDMVAQIHRGEMIVPAAQAAGLRAAVPGGFSAIGDMTANVRAMVAMEPAGRYALSSSITSMLGSGVSAAAGHANAASDARRDAMQKGGDTFHHHYRPSINLTAQGRLTKNEIADHARTIADVLYKDLFDHSGRLRYRERMQRRHGDSF